MGVRENVCSSKTTASKMLILLRKTMEAEVRQKRPGKKILICCDVKQSCTL